MIKITFVDDLVLDNLNGENKKIIKNPKVLYFYLGHKNIPNCVHELLQTLD